MLFRSELIARSPGSLEEALQGMPAQREIERLGAALRRRIADFVLARRADWHPDFFGALLF